MVFSLVKTFALMFGMLKVNIILSVSYVIFYTVGVLLNVLFIHGSVRVQNGFMSFRS